MKRKLKGKQKRIIASIAILYSLFQIYTAGFGTLPDIQQPIMHVLIGFILVFSLWGANKHEIEKRWIPVYDIILIGVTLVACLNAFINHTGFLVEPFKYSTFDLVCGASITLLILESARRTIGWVLPLLAVFMLVYTWVQGAKPEFMLVYIYHFDLGVWGMLTLISSTIVAIFLIFGSFLLNTGGGQTFIDIANGVAGKYRGGPAKIAVIASSLFGMLSGSPVANTATTGNFTIPLMKRVGYRPEIAGAIEAAASTGGLMVPPVMGAAAFIIAEMLSISYLKVAIHAIIPAVLYYVSIFCFVHFEAIKKNLLPSEKGEERVWEVLTWARLGPLVLPLAFFVGFLVHGFTALFSAFLAVLVSLACFILKDLNPLAMKERMKQLLLILEQGGIAVAYIVPLLVCAQIVIGMLGESGLGVQIASMITSLGEGSKVLALIMAAILTLILGMGVPPVGAYVLAVAVTSPALLRLGVTPIASHMFCFNFSTFAAITPPVCAAVYVGAAIAEANWLKTGYNAVRIAAVAYIVPFTYTLSKPYLLGIGPLWAVLGNFVLVLPGAMFISSAIVGSFYKGPISFITRMCFGAGGLLLLVTFGGWTFSLLGAGLVGLGFGVDKLYKS